MITIRPEQPDDFAAIRQVNTEAFGRPTEAELVDRLREVNQPAISLVAVDNAGGDEQVVGHLLLSPVTIETNDGGEAVAWGLAPMAVSPTHQGRGIGGQLIQRGLSSCQGSGQSLVFVLGHPSYYPRFGFVPALLRGFIPEFDVPDEAFMVAELEPEAAHGISGVVHFHPTFLEMDG